MSALYEHLLQLVKVAGLVDGVNLCSRHHAVAHLRLRKLQGVLEYAHLLLYLVLVACIVDTRLHQVVEVYLRELFLSVVVLHLDSQQSHDEFGEYRGKIRDRPQHDIAHPCRQRKECQQRVGIRLKDSLRQELAGKEHDERGQQRVGYYPCPVTETMEKRLVEDTCKQYTVDDQRNIVAHQHRGNKVIRMTEEKGQGALRQSVFLALHFGQQAIAGHESNLHTREEGGEYHRYD